MQFATLPALISAALVLGENNSDDSARLGDSGGGAVTHSEVNGAAGFVTATSGLAMLANVAGIFVRFCNIGLINLKCKTIVPIVSIISYIRMAD